MRKKRNIEHAEIDSAEIVKDISRLYMWDFLSADIKKQFCDVDENGCLKYKECDRKDLEPHCYHKKERSKWCEHLIPRRKSSDKVIPNPSGILLGICKDCKPEDKIYRDCIPCPYYGCIIPGEDDEHCPFRNCFNTRGSTSDFRINPYQLIWCYITGREFRRFQRDKGLWAGSFIYRDVNGDLEPYYLMKNTIAPFQFLSTHFRNPDTQWEPIEDEQLKWHTIATIRKKESGLKQFKLLEDFGRLSAREKELGTLIVEDGEFSFFLLLWRFKRIYEENPSIDCSNITGSLTLRVQDDETALFKELEGRGLGAELKRAWPEIVGQHIHTTIMQEFANLGLIENTGRGWKRTDRYKYLMVWLSKTDSFQGADKVFFDNINNPALKPYTTKFSLTHLTSLSNYIFKIAQTVTMDHIIATARFPLVGHYFIRKSFCTPLHWVLFPVMYYSENTMLPISEDYSPRRIPVGIFIGLFHCEFKAFDDGFFGRVFKNWQPIINSIVPAANQYFLETVIEKNRQDNIIKQKIRYLTHRLNNDIVLQMREDIGEIDKILHNNDNINRLRDKTTTFGNKLEEILHLLENQDEKETVFTLRNVIEPLIDSSGNIQLLISHKDALETAIRGFQSCIAYVLDMRIKDAFETASGLGGKIIIDVGRRIEGNIPRVVITIRNPGRLSDDVIEYKKTGQLYKSTSPGANRNAQGIPLCKEIIKMHHGSFDYDNTDDGVYFDIQLPEGRTK